MDTILPDAPKNYWQLIKASLRLYQACFFQVLVLSFLMAFVTFIPRFVSISIDYAYFENLPVLSLHRLWFLMANLIAILLFVSIIWRMHCTINRVHETYGQDIKIGLHKFLYVFVANILQAVIILGMTAGLVTLQMQIYQTWPMFAGGVVNTIISILFILIITAAILYICPLFYLLIPLIAIEDKGVISSLQRSAYLTWNHWLRLVTVQITPFVCYLFTLFLLREIFHIQIPIYFTTPVTYSLWPTIINMIVFAFFIPWFAALLIVQLKDFELRKHIVVT